MFILNNNVYFIIEKTFLCLFIIFSFIILDCIYIIVYVALLSTLNMTYFIILCLLIFINISIVTQNFSIVVYFFIHITLKLFLLLYLFIKTFK